MRLSYRLMPLLACLICPLAWSYAPVVDDSENFALLEDQVSDRAVVGSSLNDHSQQALAHEDQTPVTSKNLDLLNRVNGLQQELQELRGQLDQQTLALHALQAQSGTFAATPDIAQKNAPLPAISEPTYKPEVTVKSASESTRYLSAFNLIKLKEFAPAMTAMQNFVADYPAGEYTANAHYWLGELYLQNKEYDLSLQQFDRVLTQFPSSIKYADSLLKMGYALAAMGKNTEAQQRLQSVISQYPDTKVSELARTKMASLGA